MIASLTGRVEDLSLDIATVVVNGVGYEVQCTQSCAGALTAGKDAHVVVYTDVKEDSIRLYGFKDRTERQVFLLLLKVTGVGARTGVDILSRIDKLELLRIIGAGDATRLEQVKGIGKKTAARIIVELKDKVSEFAENTAGMYRAEPSELPEAVRDALAALQALGFSKRDAERALAGAKGSIRSSMSPGEIVRESLRYI